MFTSIEAHDFAANAGLLSQMFRLRKRVFHDELGWSVTVIGDQEKDSYDDLMPVYLVWCSPDRQTLYGSMRLMPTTGPTLLYDVFRMTFPDAADLSAPGIWEATRTCIDSDAIAKDFPEIPAGQAFGLLCLATAECAVAHSIGTLICNYEPHMKRVYAKSGAQIQELGRADGFGRRPVCCGAFATGPAIVQDMRTALKVDLPLYRKEYNSLSNSAEGMAA